jgi:hypothetical protein
MSNTLLNISQITNKAMLVLENQITFTKQVNREYDDLYAIRGAKIGDTANVRKPPRYLGRRTAPISVENSTETSVAVTLNTQYGCDVSFTSKELALNIDDFADRILAPAIATVANMIDYDGMQLYKDIYNHVGTPGTTPSAGLTYLQAGVKLDNEAAPNDRMRAAVLNPIAQATIVDANKTLFNPSKNLSDQYENGEMGRAYGLKFGMSQNVGVQTIGTYVADVAGGAVTVNGAVSSGSTVILAGWTSGDLLTVGDIVTFAGVYAVNPQTRQSTGQLRQFVLTATPTAATGGGAMTISISPAVVVSGAFQNVTGEIASGAVMSVYGASGTSTPQNLVFHRDAFTFATADLELPGGVDMAKRVSSKKLGISMRLVRAYDINNDRLPCRIDILGGWKTLRPELAARVSG